MKKALIGLFLVFMGYFAVAQLHDRIWIFGRPKVGTTNATLYFGNLSSPVQTLPCGQPSHISTSNGVEEWMVATDAYSGALIFYTDGQQVFDNMHNMVDIDTNVAGYESLGGSRSSCQPAAACLIPGTSGEQFLIFSNPTGSDINGITIAPITYRNYNVNTQVFGPAQFLPGPYSNVSVSEGMKIIPSANDPNLLWLITSIYPSAGYEKRYVIYQINSTGVYYHGEVDMGPIKSHVSGSTASPIINITYTNAGVQAGKSLVGFAVQYPSSVFVAEFDNLAGTFDTSTVRIYYTGLSGSVPSVYDAEFSPSGGFLYFSIYYYTSTTNRLYQIDLSDPLLSAVLVNSFSAQYAGGLCKGPDGYIYHICDNGSQSTSCKLGRIIQPDVEFVPGVTSFTSFYQENYQTYPNIYGFGLCEFLTLPKGFITTEGYVLENLEMSVFPNPFNDDVNVSIDEESDVLIYDYSGRLVFSNHLQKGLTTLDISNLKAGVYVMKCVGNTATGSKRLMKL